MEFRRKSTESLIGNPEGMSLFGRTRHRKNNIDIPYILESNPRLVFAPFLNEKKLVRASNPHLSFNRPLPV
jgi:hypothetical protein